MIMIRNGRINNLTACLGIIIFSAFSVCFGTESKAADFDPHGKQPTGRGDDQNSKQLNNQKTVHDPPKRGPRLMNLRYDEDFSYLDRASDTFEEDFFDPIKYIHWGDEWRLSLGGEIRFRFESETNKAFGATELAQDAFVNNRILLHADLKYHDTFRVFIQGIHAFDEERDLALRGIDENRMDFHQLFFDVRLPWWDDSIMLRVGRQELQYGAQRLISPLNWASIRRRFEGFKLFTKKDLWDIDFWLVRPVVVQREQHDRNNEDVIFSGIYSKYKGIANHGLELYGLALEDIGFRVNPNGDLGDVSVFTLGARFWGKQHGFDYETEIAGQWGHWAGDTVQAWSFSLDGGYTFAEMPGKPRLGIGFDWASGDDDPLDGKAQTFHQHFPLGHQYFGFLDLIGRQNIVALNVNLSAWPVAKKVKARMAYHAFWLDEERDALYNAGGGVGRRDLTGHSGKEVGQELDVTLLWKLNVHASILIGYSHFWDGPFIQHTGVSENADLIYIQYAMKF